MGFRWATRARARLDGVTGFVRNEDDGSVYIEVEGEDQAIESFLAWCRRGPPSAWVERVRTEPGEVQGFSDFDIRF